MIIENKIVESAQAQVLLEIAGLAEYPPVVYPPVIDNTKSFDFEETVPNIETKTSTFIKIYPNPAKDNLFVEYSLFDFKNNCNTDIILYSENGEKINSFKITQSFGIIPINIRNLAPGVYLIKLNDTTMKFTKM